MNEPTEVEIRIYVFCLYARKFAKFNSNMLKFDVENAYNILKEILPANDNRWELIDTIKDIALRNLTILKSTT